MTRERIPTRRQGTTVIRDHMPALDGLRGAAVLLVLAHTFDLISRTGAHAFTRGAIDDSLNAGWIGVQLFFVLSGFLITGILLDTRDSPHYYKTFFTRRALRIFPLYYLVLIIAYIVIPLDMSVPAGHGAHQGWLWTYTNNYAAALGKEEPAFPHFWSLAVEEQFYLVWPFVVRFIGRRGVLYIAPLAVIAAIVARVLARQHFGEDAAYMFTPCRMDALALGALAAAWVRAPKTVFDRLPPLGLQLAGTLLVVGGLVLGKLDRTGAQMQLSGYTIIAMGFALILIGSLAGNKLLEWSLLRRVGTYSYGMYVFGVPLHLFVGMKLIGASPTFWVAILYIPMMMGATFLLAALSYHLFERQFLALKVRLAP